MLFIYILIATAVIGIDQLTKILLLNSNFTYIPHFLYNTPTLNDGAAFSLMSGMRLYFVIFTTIILIIAGYLLIFDKFSKNKFFKIGLAITMGGIVGNFIDRIVIGKVRDFLMVEPFGFICNMADIATCVGTVLICYYIIFMHDFRKKKHENVDEKKDQVSACDQVDSNDIKKESIMDNSQKDK